MEEVCYCLYDFVGVGFGVDYVDEEVIGIVIEE